MVIMVYVTPPYLWRREKDQWHLQGGGEHWSILPSQSPIPPLFSSPIHSSPKVYNVHEQCAQLLPLPSMSAPPLAAPPPWFWNPGDTTGLEEEGGLISSGYIPSYSKLCLLVSLSMTFKCIQQTLSPLCHPSKFLFIMWCPPSPLPPPPIPSPPPL